MGVGEGVGEEGVRGTGGLVLIDVAGLGGWRVVLPGTAF